MVGKYFFVALESGCGDSSCAHCYEVEGYVSGGYSVDEYEAEELFEVGCYFESGVECAAALEYFPTAVE